MLSRRSKKVRSAPAYVTLGDEVVSLVLEREEPHAGHVGDAPARKMRPTAVYLIDSNGVSKLPIQRRKRGLAPALLFLALCLLCLLRVWRRGNG